MLVFPRDSEVIFEDRGLEVVGLMNRRLDLTPFLKAFQGISGIKRWMSIIFFRVVDDGRYSARQNAIKDVSTGEFRECN